ncbi:MAG: hypothetical protein ACHQNA_04510, partial [Acidimicrobiales bacterium]
MLALWNPTAITSGPPYPAAAETPDTLYLVDPAGGRYLLGKAPPGPSSLVDWSGDGRRALFVAPNPGAGNTVTVIDVTTGATLSSFTTANPVAATFTRPDGLARLLGTGAPGVPTLERAGLDGRPQVHFRVPASGVDTDHVLYSPDGTRLYVSTGTGFSVLGNDGTALGQLPGAPGCGLIRWWADGTALLV